MQNNIDGGDCQDDSNTCRGTEIGKQNFGAIVQVKMGEEPGMWLDPLPLIVTQPKQIAASQPSTPFDRYIY